jgi:putative methionine-R-sulfoxide reductase with GAF domain
MVIISDTTKEEGITFISDVVSNIKSIICYPIIENSSVEYMICVSSSKKNAFNKDNEKRNEYALEIFAKRIKLEMYLKTIKEAIYERT